MVVSTGFRGREIIHYDVNVLIKSIGLEEAGSRTGDDLHNTVMPDADALTPGAYSRGETPLIRRLTSRTYAVLPDKKKK